MKNDFIKFIHRFFTTRLKNSIKNDSGLSLVEMIIAISISSLIMIMVYSAHNMVTKAIYQLTGVADFYENVNLVIRRMEKDISCAFFNKDNKNLAFIGESNNESPFDGKLNFTTVDHKDFSMLSDIKKPYPESDVKEVGYYLKQDEKFPDLHFLIRREETHYDDNPEAGGLDNVLLENVTDLDIEYKKGNDWTSKWDSRDSKIYPELVKITLKVRNYNKEVEEFVFLTGTNMNR
jgi:general secretion pathway protein J